MIKYISVATDGAMWNWDDLEDATGNLLGDYPCTNNEQVFIYEVEVEPASLNDFNVFVVDDGCVEFFKSAAEIDGEFDCDIEGIYTIKKYLRTWQYKLELTETLIDGTSLPLLP